MKKLAIVALAAACVIGSTAAAQAAQTRTLPTGETLYAVDCQNEVGQLVSTNVTDGTFTAIGTGTPDSHISCAADSAYDPNSGFAYFTAWNGAPNGFFKVDPATGVETYLGDVSGQIDSADIDDVGTLLMGTDSRLFALVYDNGGENLHLGQLDITTGAYTEIAGVTVSGTQYSSRNVWGGSYNPADGKFYFVNSQNELYSLDIATGAATLIGDNPASTFWSIAFDSNGTIWSTGNGTLDSATVAGWANSGDTEETSTTTLDGSNWYSESNFVAYNVATPAVPTLAKTGGESPMPLAILGATAIAIGVASVRRRKTA